MKGFTIVELIVSIAIFAFMTALVLARYGTFNQNTLLTNMAYDMALTVRTAQSYGLSVKSVDNSPNNFNSAYGIHFDLSPGKNNQFVFFTDINKNGIYDESNINQPNGDQDITKYTLTNGATITSICLNTDISHCSDPANSGKLGINDKFDITYRRPNPNAYFYCTNTGPYCAAFGLNTNPLDQQIAYITITASDKKTSQVVVVRKNGQISVGN